MVMFYFQNGGITYFYVEDWNFVNEFRHVVVSWLLIILEKLTLNVFFKSCIQILNILSISTPKRVRYVYFSRY